MGLIKKLGGGSKGFDTLGGLAPSGEASIKGLTGEAAAEAQRKIAKMQKAFADKAIAQERAQFDKTYAMQQPFIQAGVEQLRPLARSATPEGYAADLESVMEGDVGATRQGFVEGYAPTVGLRRDVSGVGDLKMREAMGISDILNQRRQSLAGKGLTSSDYTAGIGQDSASNISNLLSSVGSAQSQSILGASQARQQGLTNLANLGVGLYDYFRKDQ